MYLFGEFYQSLAEDCKITIAFFASSDYNHENVHMVHIKFQLFPVVAIAPYPIPIYYWRASKSSETLSGVYKFELVRYMCICIRYTIAKHKLCAHITHELSVIPRQSRGRIGNE